MVRRIHCAVVALALVQGCHTKPPAAVPPATVPHDGADNPSIEVGPPTANCTPSTDGWTDAVSGLPEPPSSLPDAPERFGFAELPHGLFAELSRHVEAGRVHPGGGLYLVVRQQFGPDKPVPDEGIDVFYIPVATHRWQPSSHGTAEDPRVVSLVGLMRGLQAQEKQSGGLALRPFELEGEPAARDWNCVPERHLLVKSVRGGQERWVMVVAGTDIHFIVIANPGALDGLKTTFFSGRIAEQVEES